ncbi:hypothetical protein TVAG_021160 [Trichomonas vaginalis G3]|uniref:Uncharacterized protein n=1 Tax=Trichomonas vaginalis (strain ATCC PRA-98 / G3) TaxID=412133 RepID=A2DH98_TRIV3|nr:hypothetical protein TVAGG3_0677560 [Trichomonas vaginalis G3]EAY20171.1 hypothetical protein TVAG_021160 [Trichomonas vaginalis G3]KAI5507651.1 hypothetical protein TVAGG3_0677560 [Trichomonas vaginalis G3]|eukprot:XP_001581157.1 hypothetical protein [Trichomonas vaginalis G3]
MTENEVYDIWRNIDGILKNSSHNEHQKQNHPIYSKETKKTPKTPERPPPKRRLQKEKQAHTKRRSSDEHASPVKNIQLPNYSHDNIVMRMFFLRWLKKLAEKLQSNTIAESVTVINNKPEILQNSNLKYIKGSQIDKLQTKNKPVFVDNASSFQIDFEMTSPSPSKQDLAFASLSDGSTINDASFSCSEVHESFNSISGVQSGLEATIYDLSLSQLVNK